jgi:hypothetical protein
MLELEAKFKAFDIGGAMTFQMIERKLEGFVLRSSSEIRLKLFPDSRIPIAQAVSSKRPIYLV